MNGPVGNPELLVVSFALLQQVAFFVVAPTFRRFQELVLLQRDFDELCLLLPSAQIVVQIVLASCSHHLWTCSGRFF